MFPIPFGWRRLGTMSNHSGRPFSRTQPGTRSTRPARGRRLAFEPLEGRALLSVSGTLMVNGTAVKSDNIVLYNPAGSTHVDTQQWITAVFKNTGNKATFDVLAESTGAGAVTVVNSHFPDLPKGAVCTVMLTPTANSSKPNDVRIVLKANGKKVASDVMTVVKVDFNDKVYSLNTPQEMLDAGAYRIKPRKNTPFKVHVTPNLANSMGQSVTLRVTGQSRDHGTATINGKPSYKITSGTDVTVNLNGGTIQTRPGAPLAYANGAPEGPITNVAAVGANPYANQLRLVAEVRGKKTLVQSDGFSVAAIPVRMGLGTAAGPAAGKVGFNVAMLVTSDSGRIDDLSQVGIGELVEDLPEDGYAHMDPFENSNGQYAGPASSHGFNDEHTTPLAQIRKASDVFHGLNLSGYMTTKQVYQFVDARTGVSGIPIAGSGFTITKAYSIDMSNPLLPTVSGTISKAGANVVAMGLGSTAGGGNAVVRSFNRVSLAGFTSGAASSPRGGGQSARVGALAAAAPSLSSNEAVAAATSPAPAEVPMAAPATDPWSALGTDSIAAIASAVDVCFDSSQAGDEIGPRLGTALALSRQQLGT